LIISFLSNHCIECLEVAASFELAGLCVLFLWERVKDLRVQELLRELVGITALSDLTGSFIVKILHYDEDRDVRQVARSSI